MKGNILLVDDETINLDVLSRRLGREGYLVSQAESGRKALDLMQVQKFDLVILDVRMPDAKTRSTPVIMLSAHATDKIIRKCLLLGAADYLTKPLIMDLARNRIEINLPNREQPQHAASADLTFLLVDDHPLNIDLLERMINKLGYRAITASSGQEALKKIGAEKIDLVLLDIIMPGMSGLQVLSEIRKTHGPGQLPVIMVTAEDDNATMLNAITEGANDYVTKPYDMIFLRKRIEACLATQMLVQQNSLGAVG
jgi:DNA-binding response OmpR family regulator